MRQILIACGLLVGTVHGQVLFQHVGATNPKLSGWQETAQGIGVVASAITNDLGLGTNAWSIDDDTTDADHIYYSAILTSNDQTLVNQNGWRLTVRVRVIDFPTSVSDATSDNNSIAVQIRPGDGGREFDLILGSDMSDGSPSVIANGIYHWVDDYATIIVEYLPRFGEWGRSSLEMSINGTQRYSYNNPSPNGSGTPYIAWGSFGGTTLGQGAWAEVTFEAVSPVDEPEFTLLEFDQQYVWMTLDGIRKGVYYQVRDSSDLSSTNWTLLSGWRPSSSGTARWRVDRTDQNERFFRVNTK